MLILRCAWCRKISFLGIWVKIDDELMADLEIERRLTDGICYACFKEQVHEEA